jgi:hypothetical protein
MTADHIAAVPPCRAKNTRQVLRGLAASLA